MGRTAVCQSEPFSKIAMSTVPLPMSTTATPEFLLVLGDAGLGGRELGENRALDLETGAVQAGDRVLGGGGRRGDHVHVGLEPRAAHARGIADAFLIVDHVFLGEDVEDLTVGRNRHRLGGVDHAPDVFLLDHAVARGDRDDAARVDALDVGSRDAHAGLLDLDPGHELGLFDHLLDRFDGGVEVDDNPLAHALRFGVRGAHHVEAAVVHRLRDDRADLVGADVESRDVPVVLTSHGLSVPYSLVFGGGMNASAAEVGFFVARGGFRVDPVFESQIEVFGVRAAFPELLAQGEEGQDALSVRRFGEFEHGAVAAKDDHEVAGAIHRYFRNLGGEVAEVLEQNIRPPCAVAPDIERDATQAADDGQVETRGAGPEKVDQFSRSVHDIELVGLRESDREALGHVHEERVREFSPHHRAADPGGGGEVRAESLEVRPRQGSRPLRARAFREPRPSDRK